MTEIHVVCDADGHKEAKIARLFQDGRGWTDMGKPSRRARYEAAEDAQARGVTLGIPQRQTAGPHRISTDDDDANDDANDHYKFTFRCHICGLDVQARRDRLETVLDTLATAGISSVTLKGLGSRVQ